MSELLEQLKEESDPQGWNNHNDFDIWLEQQHPHRQPGSYTRKRSSKLKASWSTVKSCSLCPRSVVWAMWPEEFELPQAAAFSASSVASLRGNLIQTILEFVYKHDFLSLSASQLVQSLQASWRWGVEEYHPLRFITIEELVAIRTDIFSHLQGILVNINDHHLYGPPGTVKMEEPLWWDLPSVGVRLTGRADMIIDDASTARFWLLDGKYTQKPQFLEKDQLSFYALILQHMCKKQVNRACFWLYPSYQVWDLSDSCLTQQALYNVQQKATKVAHDLLDKNTQATPSRDACIFCQHKEYCPEHQDWSRQSMIIPGTRK